MKNLLKQNLTNEKYENITVLFNNTYKQSFIKNKKILFFLKDFYSKILPSFFSYID